MPANSDPPLFSLFSTIHSASSLIFPLSLSLSLRKEGAAEEEEGEEEIMAGTEGYDPHAYDAKMDQMLVNLSLSLSLSLSL